MFPSNNNTNNTNTRIQIQALPLDSPEDTILREGSLCPTTSTSRLMKQARRRSQQSGLQSSNSSLLVVCIDDATLFHKEIESDCADLSIEFGNEIVLYQHAKQFNIQNRAYLSSSSGGHMIKMILEQCSDDALLNLLNSSTGSQNSLNVSTNVADIYPSNSTRKAQNGHSNVHQRGQQAADGKRKKVNLIVSASNSETIIFAEDKTFWQFVYAILLASSPSSTSSSTSSTSSEYAYRCIGQVRYVAKRGTMGIFSTHSGSSDFVDVELQVKQGKLTYSHAHDNQEKCIILSQLRALTLSVDYLPPLLTQLELSRLTFEMKRKSSPAGIPQANERLYASISLRVAVEAMNEKIEAYVTDPIPSSLLKGTSSPFPAAFIDEDNDKSVVIELSSHFSNQQSEQNNNSSLNSRTEGRARIAMKSLVSSPELSMDLIIPLQTRDNTQALKLSIVSVENINFHLLKGKSAAQLYCVVYLLDKKGDVFPSDRSVLVSDRTQPVHCEVLSNEDCCVFWKTEFILRCEAGAGGGIDAIDSVLIKVKEAHTGNLRDPHVGQVVLPVGVFVDQEEDALLKLPIESTSRMIEQSTTASAGRHPHPDPLAGLGNIVVNTKLIRLSSSSAATDSVPKKRPSILWPSRASQLQSNPSSAPEGEEVVDLTKIPKSACLRVQVAPVDVSKLWFHMMLLGPSAGLPQSQQPSPTGDHLRVVDQVESSLFYYCLLHQECMLIRRTIPGSSDATQLELWKRVDWNRITQLKVITPSVIAITYECEYIPPRLDDAAKKRPSHTLFRDSVSSLIPPMTSSQQQQQQVQIVSEDILLVSCPAKMLHKYILHRKELAEIRHGVKYFVTCCQPFLSAEEDHSLDYKMDLLTVLRSGVDLFTTVCTRYDIELRTHLHSFKQVRLLRYIVTILSNLQFLYHKLPPPSPIPQDETSTSTSSTRGPHALLFDASLFSQLEAWRKRARNLTKPIVPPKAASATKVDYSTLPPINVDADSITTLLTEVVSSCVARVKVEIIFSVNTQPIGKQIHRPDAIFSEELAQRVESLVNDHYTICSELLSSFLASKKAFMQLAGQESKTKLLKYLSINDDILVSKLRPFLTLANIRLFPEPLLVGIKGLESVVEIYSKTLVSETRRWLAKTIEQSMSSRRNVANLPWDVDDSTSQYYISTLPESLRFQLNVYTDLCKDSFSLLTAGIEDPEEKKQKEEAWNLVRFPEHVVRAICECLLLLSEEFALALQSRHWSYVTSSHGNNNMTSSNSSNCKEDDAQLASFKFLVSIANDAYRMSTVHLSELLRLDSSIPWSQDTSSLIQRTMDEYQRNIENAVKHVTRIIFSDLTPILLDFEQLWFQAVDGNVHKLFGKSKSASSYSSPLAVICVTIQDYFHDIRTRMVEMVYFQVLDSVAGVIVTRYFMFLRECHEKYSRGELNIFSGSGGMGQRHYDQMQLDVAQLIETFGKESSLQLHHHLNPLSNKLSALADAITVISAESESSDFKHALQHLIDRKLRLSPTDGVLLTNAIAALMSLRLDCAMSASSSDNTKSLVHKNALILQMKKMGTSSSSMLVKPSSSSKLNSSGSSSSAGSEDIIVKAFRDNSSSSESSSSSNGSSNSGGNNLAKNLRELVGVPLAAAESKEVHMKRCLGLLEQARVRGSDAGEALAKLPYVSNEENGNGSITLSASTSFTTSTPGKEKDKEGKRYPISLFNRSESRKGKMDALPEALDMSRNMDHCSLVISSIKARNLVTKAVFGEANAYVVFSIGLERLKTPVKWNSAEPEWPSEEIAFDYSKIFLSTLTDRSNKTLHVRVYDKERLARKTLIGETHINIGVVDLHPIDSWFALEGGVIGCSGEIHLTITIR